MRVFLEKWIQHRSTRIFGWVVTIISAFVFLLSGAFKILMGLKLLSAPGMTETMARIGWGTSFALPLGLLEFVIVLLYLFPRTTLIGAILGTAYLGGAIAAHVRIDEPFVMPLFLGVCLWGGLVIRRPEAIALFLEPHPLSGPETISIEIDHST